MVQDLGAKDGESPWRNDMANKWKVQTDRDRSQKKCIPN